MYNSYLLNCTKFIYLLTINIFLTPCLYRYRLLLIGFGGFLLFLCPLLIAFHNNRTLKRISARCRGNIAMQQKQINVSRNNQLFWPHYNRVLSFIPIENGPSVFVSVSKFPLKSQPFVVSTFTGYSTISFSLWRCARWNRYIRRTIIEMLRFCLRTNGIEIQCIDRSTSILEIDTVIDWWLCDSIPV